MIIRFNINDYVAIRITERGRQVYRDHFEALGLDPEDYRRFLRPDPDGRVKIQFHEVMHIFGPACFMGPEPPIETEIEIETKGEG